MRRRRRSERIDAELAQIVGGAPGRAALAARLGQEIAAGFGLAALATVLAVAALGLNPPMAKRKAVASRPAPPGSRGNTR